MATKSYILETWRGGWHRFFIDCAWPSRAAAEKYCARVLSKNEQWRISSSDLPVSLPEFVRVAS